MYRWRKFWLKVERYRRVRWPRRVRKFKLMSRHPFAVPVVTIGLLAIITGGILYLNHLTNHTPPPPDAKMVIISHDGVQQIVPTRQATVGSLLSKLKIVLHQGDVVEPAAATPIDQDQFRINIYRALPVEIVDGSQKTFTFSAATTGRAIAEQVGVNLYPEDIAQRQPAENFLRDGAIGEQVVINRATPVNVDLYGTEVVLRTHATTIAGLIKEKGIKLTKSDQVIPDPSTPITAGQQITFLRSGTVVETDTETIPMPIQTINDDSLAYGTDAIRQQGAPGQQIVTYQVTLQNNVEINRTVIESIVVKAPVTQIEAIGTSLSGIKGDMAL